jgi:predicted AAA+ superfamily ATPase
MLNLRDLRRSFFLWGPRQTGKSYLLQQSFKHAHCIDLLRSELFVKYQSNPGLLRQELMQSKKNNWVILDEIQRVPSLLNEVHWLIENQGLKFGLCGSSARKVKRGHANLLGGRALRYQLHGLSAMELNKKFNLTRLLNHGYLPSCYLDTHPKDLWRSYCADYLKEEIAAEGLVRNLPAFSNFLDVAILSDTEMINYATIARDIGVSQPSVKSYFEILEDTLIGSFLPAYRRRPKRRVIQTPKFYFFDVGMVNFLAKRGTLTVGSELFGRAFENWAFHELCCFRDYCNPDLKIAYWRLPSGVEVDFIINEMEVAVEVKATSKVHTDHLKGLRSIIEDHPKIKRRIVVSLEETSRITDDGIEILCVADFVSELANKTLVTT